jgi:hypothetical protein
MTFDIHESLRDRQDEIRWEKAHRYIDGLMEFFAESSEGRELLEEGEDLGWAAHSIRMALEYTGFTPPEMTAAALWELLFEWIPRKVSAPASRASSIIRQCRALWRFLDRQFQLENAAACLEILDDKAVRRLERAMSDPANFGPAKSLVMGAQEAGFDTSTEAGLAKAMLAHNLGLIPRLGRKAGGSAEPAPSLPPMSEEPPRAFLDSLESFEVAGRPAERAKSARKAKRKAAKLSRKKNRRKR